MRRILKYTLTMWAKQTLHLPTGAIIRSVDVVDEVPRIWVEVEDSNPLEAFSLTMVGTGTRLYGDEGEYLDTILMDGGSYVWHIHIKKEQ